MGGRKCSLRKQLLFLGCWRVTLTFRKLKDGTILKIGSQSSEKMTYKGHKRCSFLFGKNLARSFSKEDVINGQQQIYGKYSVSLIIRKVQIKTAMQQNFQNARNIIIKKDVLRYVKKREVLYTVSTNANFYIYQKRSYK